MILLKDINDCYGCGACSNICPVSCISMQENTEGFLYPHVNNDLCINCSLCKTVCPVLNKNLKNSIKSSFAVRGKKEDLEFSSSGGFFGSICRYVIEKKKGYVFAATFNQKFEIIHEEFNDLSALKKFLGSKYVQSNMSDVFKRIKKRLDKGNYVLFAGTPCQVSAVNNFLKRDYENFLTLEVICHGVASPLFWSKYQNYIKDKYNSSIVNVNFRSKKLGYHSSGMLIEFENGRRYFSTGRTDIFLRSFFSELTSRKSCYRCEFKGNNRVSDFSIFDCWSASSLINKKIDDSLGFTNVLVNSERAALIIKELEKYINIYPIATSTAISKDGIMVNSLPIENQYRSLFYNSVQNNDFNFIKKHILRVSFKDNVFEKIKHLLHKLGLFNVFIEAKKWMKR